MPSTFDQPHAIDGASKTSRTAYVETYGCQMNISDGELMEGILSADGYTIVTSPDEADVVLVNTCAIREHAERRVIGRVGHLNKLREDRPGLILGVTGCMAQRIGGDLLERAPYIDLVVGPDGYRSLPDKLRALRLERPLESAKYARSAKSRGKRVQLTVLDLDPRENYEGLEQRRTSMFQAWVPIQRGCDHRCTYCIVPYVRGDEKNRHPEEVLGEIRSLAETGTTEVTLLGQTVNSYTHGDVDFPDLLRRVAGVDGIQRVRFTSPHPNDLTAELIEVLASEPALCEHLHLPLQAGADRTLKRMARRHTVAEYLDKVLKVREAVPDIALSTDVIVAFPGETQEEFRDTLDVLREVRYDDAFTYKYSLREGTPATRLPAEDFVDDEVAQGRLEELIHVCRTIQSEINTSEIGRVDEVLVERLGRDAGTVLGRTRRAKVVVFPAGGLGSGEYAFVRKTHTTGPTFVGEQVAAAERVGSV